MTEHWEHQQLPRFEIEKMREEVKHAAQDIDAARRKVIAPEKDHDNSSVK